MSYNKVFEFGEIHQVKNKKIECRRVLLREELHNMQPKAENPKEEINLDNPEIKAMFVNFVKFYKSEKEKLKNPSKDKDDKMSILSKLGLAPSQESNFNKLIYGQETQSNGSGTNNSDDFTASLASEYLEKMRFTEGSALYSPIVKESQDSAGIEIDYKRRGNATTHSMIESKKQGQGKEYFQKPSKNPKSEITSKSNRADTQVQKDVEKLLEDEEHEYANTRGTDGQNMSSKPCSDNKMGPLFSMDPSSSNQDSANIDPSFAEFNNQAPHPNNLYEKDKNGARKRKRRRKGGNQIEVHGNMDPSNPLLDQTGAQVLAQLGHPQRHVNSETFPIHQEYHQANQHFQSEGHAQCHHPIGYEEEDGYPHSDEDQEEYEYDEDQEDYDDGYENEENYEYINHPPNSQHYSNPNQQHYQGNFEEYDGYNPQYHHQQMNSKQPNQNYNHQARFQERNLHTKDFVLPNEFSGEDPMTQCHPPNHNFTYNNQPIQTNSQGNSGRQKKSKKRVPRPDQQIPFHGQPPMNSNYPIQRPPGPGHPHQTSQPSACNNCQFCPSCQKPVQMAPQPSHCEALPVPYPGQAYPSPAYNEKFARPSGPPPQPSHLPNPNSKFMGFKVVEAREEGGFPEGQHSGKRNKVSSGGQAQTAGLKPPPASQRGLPQKGNPGQHPYEQSAPLQRQPPSASHPAPEKAKKKGGFKKFW